MHRLEQPRIEVGGHALDKHPEEPFKAHARVDVLEGQRFQNGPRPEPVELGEHQVPDLHVAPAITGSESAVRAGRSRP